MIDLADLKQDQLQLTLLRFSPDIVSTAIHRVISAETLEGYSEKLINLHYSLLPSSASSIGSKTASDVLELGAKVSGVTATHVTRE